MKNLYDLSFLNELEKLNPEQRKAVDLIEGPVLVIAGPGTGKTQILSARIGKILTETDTKPHNILCLTYTDAGTVAMRKRLLKFIGPDAYRVNIFTFHAFCNQVIQENLDLFGIRGLQPISDLEKKILLEKLIDSFPSNHQLKRFSGDIYYEGGRLDSLFSIMKREGWSSDFISKKIDEYLKDLPLRKDYIYQKSIPKSGVKVGDIKFKAIEEETVKMEMLRAAAFEFDNFEKLMRAERRYDYDDMIIWVHDMFSSNKNLLAHYQERYLYLLVDEYQDTNGAQNKIIHLLASYWETPNLFAVGDDDQSIYRFQGANMTNILDYHNRYHEDISVVVLKENYRSGQSILDASKTLIENNEERLINKIEGLDKNLQAGNLEIDQVTLMPKVIEYFNARHEELSIVNSIQQLILEGESPAEIAVIYRNHKQVENMVKLLQKHDIPLSIKRKTDILSLPLIQNLLLLFEYLNKEIEKTDSAHEHLYKIMHFEFFGINHHDINTIVRACDTSKNEEATNKSWRVLMQNKEKLQSIGVQNPEPILALESNLSFWIKEAINHTLQGLFEKILTKGGLLTWIMNHKERIWYMQVVTTFFDCIKEESARANNYKIQDFISTMTQMDKYKLSLELNKSIYSENGVNFITAHSSKGLEFNNVFLIGCTRNQWEKKRGSTGTYKIPDTMTESVEENKLEEERRLFYVGMTRAKRNLILTYSSADENGKLLEASQFVEEILENGDVIKEFVHLTDNQIAQYQSDLLLSLDGPSVELMEKEFLNSVLKNYKMSVTHLNKFLSCPLRFYFENVIRVPSARNASMGFGNAVHFALEQLFRKMDDHPDKIFPDSSFFLLSLKRGLENHHSHFTKKEFDLKLEYAEKILPALYNFYKEKWNKKVLIEYSVDHVEYEGVPLTGKLDKIELEDNNKVNVIDYKTGNPSNGKKKLFAPDEKEPLGGDYWRQIIFYKILLDSDKKKNFDMVSGEIDFIEPTKGGDFIKEKVVIDPLSLYLVKNQIKETYQKIMNHEFSKGCGKDDCQWCTFVSNNFNGQELMFSAEE